MTQRVNLALIQFAVLAVWLGAAGFMSTAVAPALFAVLPSRTLAGAVVGRLLPGVFYSGMLVGVAVLALQMATDRGMGWGGRELSGIVMTIACAVAQLWVAPRIERIRAAIGGPVDALPADDARRAAFGRLHGISVGWLGLAMLAAIVALVLAARALQAQRP